MKIETGSRVAIVGGGPAGVFFALYLQRYGNRENIHPDITIYQQKDFNECGSKGCKGCAGIISSSLISNLAELGLIIPKEVIQNRITEYTMHSPYTSISITNPEKDKEIVSVYRGSGPRQSHGNKPVSFDGWLLEQARSHGINVVHQSVSHIELGSRPGLEAGNRKLECDLIVLAAGVSAGPIPITGLDYVPPETRIMAVNELYAGIDQVESRLGNTAHGFLIPHVGIMFGGLVPKGPFVTVTVLTDGRTPVTIDDFLKYDIVREVLPEKYERACSCRPRAVIGAAQNYFSENFVAIGDAAVSKLYQDGLTSSLLTARGAAHTSIYHGITRREFKRHYQPVFHDIDQDRQWGHKLFSMNNRAKNSRIFLLTQERLTGIEQDNTKGQQPFTKAAWGMLTGSYGYKNLMKGLFHPASIFRFLREVLLEIFHGLFHGRETTHRKLKVGSKKVLILGSGFGGSYTLKYLVPSLNRNENVETTMVSDDNYFLFTPLLHEVALGRIETRHIAYPIRSLQWKDRFKFVHANVNNIDLNAHKVNTTAGTLDFDYLVLALGSVSDTPESVLDAQNVFTLRTLNDAMLIRNHIIRIFEQASAEQDLERKQQLLTFVVSGADYIGVQVVTGLRDLVMSSLPKFYREIDSNRIRIILVEEKPKVVDDLDPKLGAYVMRYLRSKGIEVKRKSRVTRVRQNGIEINNSEYIPAGTVIRISSALVNPPIAALSVARDYKGRVVVDQYLEVPEAPGVYALGDCAHIKNPKTWLPISPLAHTTVRQARIVAGNIRSDIRGWDKKKYQYSRPPDMVSLGSYKAVFHFRRVRLYGYLPRLILALIYLFLVTGTPNRVRIVVDWTLSFIFSRDTTLLKLNRLKKD
jgi:NADH dehydrogenase FAD-containing subunit